MSELLKRYLPRTEFDSYEDFMQNYKIDVPADFNFGYDIVDEWARISPDKLALRWCNDDLILRDYTFAEASALSNQAANAFLKMGIRKGDIVMLILKQRPEVWWCIVGLCKIGAVCIPGTYQLKSKDIVYRSNMAGIKAIVTVPEEELLGSIRKARPDCKTLETVATLGGTPADDQLDFSKMLAEASPILSREAGAHQTRVTEPMLIYFSSGTSGMPKMVLHDHSLPLGHIVTAKYWQQVQDDHIHLTQTDSGWAKFAWGKIYGQWICGAAIGAYDAEKFVPDLMLRAMQLIRPTTFCATLTIYRYLIKEDLSGYTFDYIEHASVAGEPLNPEVFSQIEAKTGMVIREGFGQSETSVLLANWPWIKVKPGSTGKPSPLYGITLLNEQGRPCEDGEIGAICITGTDQKHPTGLFKEYFLDEAVTKGCWQNGVYNTGDMAWRDSEDYYWFVGRNDDVIKCSGYRIGPFEVESALLEHPSVLECAVTAVADPMRGQVVKATIVLARGFLPSDTLVKELQNHVKAVTAPYKYPRIVDFVSELPKTISGKIRRNEIRRTDGEKNAE